MSSWLVEETSAAFHKKDVRKKATLVQPQDFPSDFSDPPDLIGVQGYGLKSSDWSNTLLIDNHSLACKLPANYANFGGGVPQ